MFSPLVCDSHPDLIKAHCSCCLLLPLTLLAASVLVAAAAAVTTGQRLGAFHRAAIKKKKGHTAQIHFSFSLLIFLVSLCHAHTPPL